MIDYCSVGTVRGKGDVDVQSTFSEAFTEGGMSMDVDVQSAFLRFLRLLLKR